MSIYKKAIQKICNNQSGAAPIKKGGREMKYKIRYEKSNIFVSRDFPELFREISRVTARITGWEKEIPKMKREILKEAKEVWAFLG